jgi:1,2-diacylglycerol 3-alpha-glucosyltransferase
MPQNSLIAVVVDPWQHPYNGTVVSTRRFVAALSERGYQFRVLCIGDEERDGFRQLSIPGVNRIINSMRAPLARPDRALLRRCLDGVDLLHVQFPFFLGRAAILEAKRLSVPVVCSFHVQPENILQNLGIRSAALTRLLYRVFVRAIYDRADRVVAPSEFAASLLREHGLEVPISVVSNGIPQRFFDVERVAAGGSYRVLSVGRLAREKQQETLIRAVARSRNREAIDLVLVGVGPRQEFLETLARRLHVRATIGWMDDAHLLREYGRADLFVHAGAIELEGMSVLEAMAAGNAVIISDSPGSACGELISDPNRRFVAGDPDDLADRLDWWLEHPQARAEVAAEHRRLAMARSYPVAVAALSRVYEDLMSVPAARVSDARMNGSL